MPPVVHEATAYAAVYGTGRFSATGTAILFAALVVYRLAENETLSRNQTLAAR